MTELLPSTSSQDSLRRRDDSRAASRPHWLLGLLVLTFSCNAAPKLDYGPFIQHMPRSILVLPPLDESPEGNASYRFLSTVTRPLAERGYYVFPVAVVTDMMRENGLPMPHDMHQVSLSKLDEIFNPDAVLYLKVRDWGTTYQVISSDTRVTVSGSLIDTGSGAVLWTGSATAVQGSGGNSGSLLDLLVSAVVNQIATSISEPSDDLARQVSWGLIAGRRNPFLLGPRHPQHTESLQKLIAQRAKE